MKRRLVVTALVASALVSTPPASVSAGGNVAPPGSRSHGLSYAERAAAWWEWAIALPASGHPLVSAGNVDCSVGQSGHVWHLAGAFAPAPPAPSTVRACDIPSGTALFLPLVNVDCSNLEADPFFGANEAELRACVRQFGFTDLHASVDGAEIANLNRFLVESPLFSVVPPVGGNILNVPGGTEGDFVARGVHVLLRPLPVGAHTVAFGGTITLGQDAFPLDVTYHVTVVPRGRFPTS
jgi:hypothetical protein